jgi:prevent-host-death family protein
MPIQYRTMKDLKEKTPSVLRAAQRGDVVITLRGEPKALLRQISRDELEGMQLLESKRVRQLLAQAISDVKAGRTVPLNELLERTVTRRAVASR